MKLSQLPNGREAMKEKRQKVDAIIAMVVFGIILVIFKLLFGWSGI